MTDDDSRRYDVGVLVKAIDVIEALVGTNGLGLTELAAAAGVSRGSVFRIATTPSRPRSPRAGGSWLLYTTRRG